MRLAGALPLTLALMIGLETCILNGLSMFHAVNRPGLITCHILILAIWGIHARFFSESKIKDHALRYMRLFRQCLRNPAIIILIPVIILLIRTAYIFPPNNYDSMTYHMARVAHWMQNGSVAYYPSPIERQNVLGPGAEYLILFFQVLTETDLFANFVQLFSFLLLLPSLAYVLRVFKVSRKIAPFIILLTATTPMALLQATSTQNDLVAAVMTYGIILSSLRLLAGNISRMKLGEYFLMGCCLASGFLVKPTSVLVAAPFIGLGLVFQAKALFSNRALIKNMVVGLLIALMAFLGFTGPDIYRKIEHRVTRHEVYPLFSEWNAERLLNPLRIMAADLPIRNDTRRVLRVFGHDVHIDTGNVFNGHEDFAGSPYQLLALMVLSSLTIFTFWGVFRKERMRGLFLLSLAPVVSWIGFGLIVRHQVWISRLQLPIFFILPFSFIYFFRVIEGRKRVRHLFHIILIGTAFLSSAYGVLVAAKNPSRSLFLVQMWGERPSRHREYYKNGGEMEAHRELFTIAKREKCDRIGLVIGPDSVDYPLTWVAKELGIKTKFLWDFSEGPIVSKFKISPAAMQWPCMVFVDSGSTGKHISTQDLHWVSKDNFTLTRNLEWEYAQLKEGVNVLAMFEKAGVTIKNDMTVEDHAPGLLLKTTGKDPYLLLPEIRGTGSPSCIIKIEISSSQDTEIQIFYTTLQQKAFSERFSITRKIRKGDNTVYFQLPADEIVGPIRLDIGRGAGEYLLSSVEYKPIL